MLLQVETSRKKLRAVIVQTYFVPEIQSAIWKQSEIHFGAIRYASDFLLAAEAVAGYTVSLNETGYVEKARDQGFRKAIVRLSVHRCALCGIKMLTSEGHTVVDAAHIIPFSESKNNH